MNLMMWIARSAGLVCARFTALCQHTLRGLASILPTSNLRNAVLISTYVNVIDSHGTLTARAHQGLTASRLRIARWVAIVIGIALSMQSTAVGVGSIDRYYDLHSLADYQLTDKQLACHSQIVHRESSGRINARNGSHHGYYQIRNTKLIDAPYDYQFYFYWKYVQHRYGYTEYDEPDYCKALHHLKTKGWQ
jgi:hypothetical protein